MKNVHKGGPLWPTDRALLRKSAENRALSRPPAGEFAGGTAGVLLGYCRGIAGVENR